MQGEEEIVGAVSTTRKITSMLDGIMQRLERLEVGKQQQSCQSRPRERWDYAEKNHHLIVVKKGHISEQLPWRKAQQQRLGDRKPVTERKESGMTQPFANRTFKFLMVAIWWWGVWTE